VLQLAESIGNRPLLVHHVAKRLNVPPRTVRWWAEKKRLRARRLGRKIWGFERSDVEAFAATLGPHRSSHTRTGVLYGR
jgi:excisionase family DNA binding protein